MRKMELRKRIDRLPRIRLANLPTPLEEMRSLSKSLGGPKLWIKRDDLTGLVFGGNKVRKLEFEMMKVLEAKADVVVADGAIQSNHACAAANVARKLGLKTVLILRGKKPQKFTGNLLINHILGADVRFVQAEWEETGKIAQEVVEELRAEGYTPYVVPFSSPLSSVGYVNAFLELIEQAETMNLGIDYVIHASGSGGTQAGLVVGKKALEMEIGVISIAAERNGSWLLCRTTQLANDCARLLESTGMITKEDIKIFHDYVGEGYGVASQEIKGVIKKVAEIEGILLDPVYTSKAMIGLMDLIERGCFEKRDNLVFLHTGGIPAIFANETHW